MSLLKDSSNYNDNLNSCAYKRKFGTTTMSIILVITILLVIISLVSNFILFHMVRKYHYPNELYNVLIMNLALGHIFNVLFNLIPQIFQSVYFEWWGDKLLCILVNYFSVMTSIVPVYTIVVLCFDRFLSVCFPYNNLLIPTVSNLRKLAIAIWIFSAAVPIYHAIISNVKSIKIDSQTQPCFICQAVMSKFYYFFVIFNILYLLPLIAMIFFNLSIQITIFLKRQQHAKRNNKQEQRDELKVIINKKSILLSKIIMFLCLLFVILHFPIHFINCLQFFHYNTYLKVKYLFEVISLNLTSLNFSIDAWIILAYSSQLETLTLLSPSSSFSYLKKKKTTLIITNRPPVITSEFTFTLSKSLSLYCVSGYSEGSTFSVRS